MLKAFFVSLVLHLLVLSFLIPEEIKTDGGESGRLSVVLRILPYGAATGEASPRVSRYLAIQKEGQSRSSTGDGRKVNRKPIANLAAPTASTARFKESVGERVGREDTPPVAKEDEAIGDLLGEAEYRLALARSVRQQGSDHSRGIESGWRGLVVLEVRSDAMLDRPVVVLRRSSGLEDLDQDALEKMTRALHDVELPAAMLGKRFRMPLSIRYGKEN